MNIRKIQRIILLSLSFSNLLITPAIETKEAQGNLINLFSQDILNNTNKGYKKIKNSLIELGVSKLVNSSDISLDNIVEENEINKVEEASAVEVNSINELLIESKVQSEKDNILYANGNVIVTFKGRTLRTDSLSYNKNTKVAKAQGNVSLVINNQIFQADYIEYDFIKNKGYFQNVKGLINAENIIMDLDFQIDNKDNLQLRRIIAKDKVIYTPDKVTNWIFSSKDLTLDKNKLFSKQAFFTNDLLDTNQIKLQLNDLEVFSYKEKLKFKSKINYLILEDKTTIPLWFGDRTIVKDSKNSEGLRNKWTVGYDNLNKDGFFLGRKLNPIKLNNDLFLDIEPQFLLQRTLKGNTESFVQKNHALNAERVKREVSLSDYFALNASFSGNIQDWDLDINNALNSFDLEKFPNALRVRAELSKEINIFNSLFESRFFGAYRNRIWNGSIGESEIYGAYGWQLEQQKSWSDGSVEKKQVILFGIGNYKAEELTSNNLTRSYKGSVSYQFDQKIPLNEKKIVDNYIDKSYKYIPKPIKQGVFVNTKFSGAYNLYEKNNNQKYLGFGFGPEIVYGNFKRNLFDYTRFSILPFYKFKSGKSVFKFDEISEDFTIEIKFDQHLMGSLLIESQGTLNIDTSSADYGEFINSKIGLNWKKRSYSFGLFYQPHNESGGLNFTLNGFE